MKINYNEILNKTQLTILFLVQNIFTYIGIYLYLQTLEGCYMADNECLNIIPIEKLKQTTMKLFLCAFIISFQIVIDLFIIPNNTRFGLNTLIWGYIFFWYDTGLNFQHHGAYNRIPVLLFIPFFILMIFSIYYIYCMKFVKKMIIIICCYLLIHSVYIICSIVIQSWINSSCNDWYLGLKNSKMDNSNNNNCILLKPQICYFRLFYGFFDLSKLFGINSCSVKKDNNFDLNYIYIEDNIKKARLVGFPRTEKWEIWPDKYWGNIQRTVLYNLIDMDDESYPKSVEEFKEVVMKNSDTDSKKDYFHNLLLDSTYSPLKTSLNRHFTPKEKVEVVLNRDTKTLEINLKKDDDLIMKKRELFNKYKDGAMAKNVFYLFMDSLSRVEWRRKLPKFYKWVEDRYLNKDHIHQSYQFFKYHGVGMYTEQNMTPALFGVFSSNRIQGTHILKYYNNHGYITGHAINYCGPDIIQIEYGFQQNQEWDKPDHELFAPYCDLNFSTIANTYSILKGVNSNLLRCLYGKTLLEHSMDYAKQFLAAYKDEAKFFTMATYEAHEGTGEAIKYNDQMYVDFFEDLEKNGLLEDTIIYIHSDHGLAMAGPYSSLNLEDYNKELILPNFFLLLPVKMKNFEVYSQNLIMNEQSVLTPFCIYRSHLKIIGDEEVITKEKQKLDLKLDITDYYKNHIPEDDRYFSIFGEFIPQDRKCNAITARWYKSFYSGFCRCDNDKRSVSNELIYR